MFKVILKFIPALFFWGIFIYVIFVIPYPDSLTQTSVYQLLYFFTPLFLALIFTINLLLKSMIRSILISFGILVLLILKALDSLNIVSAGLIILAVGLLLSYFKPPKRLTPSSNIPKLTRWRKRHPSSRA